MGEWVGLMWWLKGVGWMERGRERGGDFGSISVGR